MNGKFLLLFKITSSVISALAVIGGGSIVRESSTAPIFDTTSINVTGIAGETANLPCMVENKGDKKIIWMNPSKTVISQDDSRHIDDSRMSVERPKLNEWNLMIREVRQNDTGEYICAINITPVKLKRVFLFVKVAPEILNQWSGNNKIVKEGETVELICNVTGVPLPVVSWFRQTELLTSDSEAERPMVGEVLVLYNVSRYCDGLYECNADNGVSPVATKQFEVTVQFPPEVQLLNKRMGQQLGKETILYCTVYASPQSSITWMKNGQVISPSYYKYIYKLYEDGPKYEKVLSLNIIDIKSSDFGNYTCHASNTLGSDTETMILHELVERKPHRTTTPKSPPVRTLRIDVHDVMMTSPYPRHVQQYGNGARCLQNLPQSLGLFYCVLQYIVWVSVRST